MAANEALDRRLVEMALEQHRDSRRVFYRDLRIACAVLLTFQCLLFFRFVQVADERAHLENQLHQLESDQIALVLIREQVAGVDATLMPLHTALQQMPVDFQSQLAVVESYRGAADAECTPGFECKVEDIDPPPGQNPIQLPMSVSGNIEAPIVGTPALLIPTPEDVPLECQFPLPDSSATPTAQAAGAVSTATPSGTVAHYSGVPQLVDYLNQLPEEEKRLLVTGSPDEEYQALVQRIVDEAIIEPLFANLNRTKEEVLNGDFRSAKQWLCVTLNVNSDMLRRNGLTEPTLILGEITAIEERMRKYPIEPPLLESWWRTYVGKEAVATGVDADVRAFSNALLSSDTQIANAAARLHELTIQLNENKKELDDKLASLESQFAQVHGTFEQLASPLPGIPIELKYAVAYYPLILATLFASFAGRYLLDRSRARQLVPLIHRLGGSTVALDLYLADYSIRSTPSDHPDDMIGRRFLPALALAVMAPGFLFAISVAWILSSQVFAEDRRWYVGLYMVAAVVMASSYWALTGTELRQAFRRSSTRRGGSATE